MDNPQALASGLSTILADKPSSSSLVPCYPVQTLHVMGYLVLEIWVSGGCDTKIFVPQSTDTQSLAREWLLWYK